MHHDHPWMAGLNGVDLNDTNAVSVDRRHHVDPSVLKSGMFNGCSSSLSATSPQLRHTKSSLVRTCKVICNACHDYQNDASVQPS